jgi:K+-sensing histidine kinase KdpD
MIMTDMDWPRVFSLLAHELRSPAAVIAGYARMLSEGRLTHDDQLQAYAQIERAAGRITAISHQASDLAQWLGPAATEGPAPLSLHVLLSQALSQCSVPKRITMDPAIETGGLTVLALDKGALMGAMVAAIDSVCREAVDPIAVSAHADAADHTCDVVMGPEQALAALEAGGRPDSAHTQFSAERGGMGLALVLCLVVVRANGGQLFTLGGRRDLLAMRLRTPAEAQ